MIEMPNPENREKVAAFIALYNHTFAEVVRYRDMEWKMTVWTVALLAGVISFTRFGEHELTAGLKTVLIVFVVAVSAFGVWHVHYSHRRLTAKRQLRQQCERILGFHEAGRYDPAGSLPENLATETVAYSEGITHLVSWWGLIVAIAVFAIYGIAAGLQSR